MMHRITTDYDLLKITGRGTFSEVFEGKRKIDGKIVAIKVIKCHNEIHDKIIMKEINIMKLVSGGHPSIPRLYDHFKEGQFYYIIMEYLDGYVTLLDWINELGQSTTYNCYAIQSNSHEMTEDLFYREKSIASIFVQIASCVAYLHSLHIFHRDLKLENIMINPITKNVKIIDFGLATHSDNMKWETICGSFEYLAPEIIQDVKNLNKAHSFTFQSEIWTLGVILYSMTYYKLPFYSQNTFDMFKSIIYLSLQLDEEELFASEELKDLILQMLSKDPVERPYFEQIFAHPFLNEEYKKISFLPTQRIDHSRSQNIEIKDTFIKKHVSHFPSSLPRSFLTSSYEYHNQFYQHKKKIVGINGEFVSKFPKL